MTHSPQPDEAEVCARSPGPVPVDREIGIVGAGFAGLIAGLQLLEAGRTSLVIFERAAEIGGVWRDNVYPGCACDVRSHLYSMEGRPNPQWTANYASQPEILAYLKRVAAEGGLYPYIRLDTEVVEARFLEQDGCWELAERGGGVFRVRTLILALGPLNRPFFPSIQGLDRFAGTTVHSSAWDPALDLAGKRVAVIGSGASAVQIVPNIAGQVERLTVFQRSAPWVLPRHNRRTTALEHWLFRRAPIFQRFMRAAIYWAMEGVGMAFFGATVLQRLLSAVALRKLRREVHDPATRRALTPDYVIGCKRMTVSDDFYPAFNRPNVRLVTEPVVEITRTGVRSRDGVLHEVDHIIFATGFIVADPDDLLRVVGVNGRVLSEQWTEEGAQAYRGVAVAGYPNLFMLLGPNSGLSYSSALHIVESQVRYLGAYLDVLDRAGAGAGAALDVRPEAQAAYNADLQARLEHTVWQSGCRSWYIDRNGRNTTIFPGPTSRYRRMMVRFDPAAYRIRPDARNAS